MSIDCKCPYCRNLCSFQDVHAGRTATCLECGSKFIIPTKDDPLARLVVKDPAEPVPGFFSSALKYNLSVITSRSNLFSLLFVMTVAGIYFFCGDTDIGFAVPGLAINLPLGWVCLLLTWGILFWYYMELIRFVSDGIEDLPVPEPGEGWEFLKNAISSVYLFIVAFIIAELPFIAIIKLLSYAKLDFAVVRVICMLAGIYILPMELTILANSTKQYHAFRFDYVFKPILKSPLSYSLTAGFLMAAWLAVWLTKTYSINSSMGAVAVTLYFITWLVIHLLILLAVRTVGLFTYHYSCYMPWFDSED